MSDLSDESEDESEKIKNFDAQAQLIIQSETLPQKSGNRYLLAYNVYKKWKQDNQTNLSSCEENNLVVYFKGLQQKLKPSTIWSLYSMLKSTLNTRDNIDISKFARLRSLLKKFSVGYKPTQSKTFTWSEIEKFLNEAPDQLYLARKVSLIYITNSYACLLFFDMTQLYSV